MCSGVVQGTDCTWMRRRAMCLSITSDRLGWRMRAACGQTSTETIGQLSCLVNLPSSNKHCRRTPPWLADFLRLNAMLEFSCSANASTTLIPPPHLCIYIDNIPRILSTETNTRRKTHKPTTARFPLDETGLPIGAQPSEERQLCHDLAYLPSTANLSA